MGSDAWLEGVLADVPGEPFDNRLNAWRDSLPEGLREVVNRIATAMGGIWLVGGSVREALLGREQFDFDLATTLNPDKLLEIFPRALPTGVQFGTVTVRIDGCDEMFEVTTLRKESDYGDGRRPDVVDFGTSLKIDLSRRDFTINAIAVDLGRQLIHDPFDGRKDLSEMRLRAVGNASHRLSEDGLRLMRGYRFMDQGERGVWLPDEELSTALREQQPMLDNVANERVWHEFSRILTGNNAADVIERMREDGMLSRILPGWDADTSPQHVLQAPKEDLAICRLVLLAAEINHERWRVLEDDLRVLKTSNNDRSRFMSLHRLLGTLPDPTNLSELRRYRFGTGNAIQAHLSIEDTLRPEVSASVRDALQSLRPLTAGDLPIIDGYAIASATGMPMGRRLGQLKSWLHRMQIELDLAGSEQVLALLDVIDWAGGDPESWPGPSWP
ncbi:MAG: CCA tRNA nucleotidyltransferase [Candidatus Thalassarchaeaceae archaeon]|jgi:tRNA nucleotidyltransferase/poly(A) polymerase|nr:CCA tRNA nucleotidyltransferase [Candidatus Thalassarchaeaceae archaeon]